jgi:hypothetical protein
MQGWRVAQWEEGCGREGIGGLGMSHDGAFIAGINEDDHSSAARVDRLIDLVGVTGG